MKSIKVNGNNSQVSTCSGKPIKEITVDGVTYTRDISKLDPVQCHTSTIYETYSTNSTEEYQTSETVRISGFLGNIVGCDASIKSLTQGDSSKIRVTADAASTQWDSTHTIATQEYVTVNFFISGASNKYVGAVELNTASQPAAYDRVNVGADEAMGSNDHLYYSACTVGFEIQRTYTPDTPTPSPSGGKGALFVWGENITDDIGAAIINGLRDALGDEYVADTHDGQNRGWMNTVQEMLNSNDYSENSPLVVVAATPNDLGFSDYSEFFMSLQRNEIDNIEHCVAYLFYGSTGGALNAWNELADVDATAANSVSFANVFPGECDQALIAFINDIVAGDTSSWRIICPDGMNVLIDFAQNEGMEYTTYERGNSSSIEGLIEQTFDENRYVIAPVTSEVVGVFDNTYNQYMGYWAESCLMQTSSILASVMVDMRDTLGADGIFWFTTPDMQEVGEAIASCVAGFNPGAAVTEYVSMDGNTVFDISSLIS